MAKETEDHILLAGQFNKDEDRVDWHDQTLWMMRKKRDARVAEIDEWEKLREIASQIKDNVLSNLYPYLIEFERNAKMNGCIVHWAANAAEHNQIVLELLQEKKIYTLVKSKSMLTEECGLNDYLYAKGIDVVDTDLGEFIIQLANEPPSHIVMPCIHKKKEEIGELFHRHLQLDAGVSDPALLTAAARQHLRDIFIKSKAALTGVNFAIADTGEFIVCTNEGNADLGVHLADIHIASMGIEKIIPKRMHLSVFLRLLARSATGQQITSYSSHFRRPQKGKEMHIIIVDNGRSKQLGSEKYRTGLKCIRCGACMNTCPVYRRSGGHSYHNTVPGPIGAILSPNRDIHANSDLPFASTLCGSCSNVCPVKINIHDQLYLWRQEIMESGGASFKKRIEMNILAMILLKPKLFRLTVKLLGFLMNNAGFLIKNRFNPWFRQREMPEPAKMTFTQWYNENK